MDLETDNETIFVARQQIFKRRRLLGNDFANKHIPMEIEGQG
jgi:hypothetical protein